MQNSDQNSPLHQAVIENDLKKISLLLSLNREFLKTQNRFGLTPLYLAKLLGRKECLNILDPGPVAPIHIIPKKEKEICLLSEEEFFSLLGVTYQSTLFFKDYASLVDTIQHCPWYIRFSPLGRENRWLGIFYEEEILHGSIADVTIRFIDDEMGYGLFTNQTLHATDFVAEYTGLIKRKKLFFPGSTEYSFRYPSRFFSFHSYVIDSESYGNYARFLNHSDIPNCIPSLAYHKGLLHLLFLAKKTIEKGSELTIDYGPLYWMHRKKKEF